MNTRELTFTKGERRIIILLIGLTFCLQYYSYNLSPQFDFGSEIMYLDTMSSERKNSKLLNSEANQKTFIQSSEPISRNFKTQIREEIPDNNFEEIKRNIKRKSPQRETTLFDFDPNTIDSTTWLKLGVKPWTIKTIIKYRNKGGVFKKKGDLKKIYGLDQKIIETLLPFCKIDSVSIKSKRMVNSKYPVLALKSIDINYADTSELKKLRGIGSKLSARIVKYRENIGGFHKINQLQEVYGLDSEVIEQNKKWLTVSEVFRKIDINNITKDSMVLHFYFDYKLAKSIITYRHQHGRITSIKDLKKIK